jgi:exodeoxyribonuclease VII large subunit
MIIYENKKLKIEELKENANRLLKQLLDNQKVKLEKIKSNYILNNPSVLYKDSQIKLNNLIDKLELVNPLGVLKRGYSLTKQDNKVISTIKNIDKKKPLVIKLQDGEIETEIKNIIQGE